MKASNMVKKFQSLYFYSMYLFFPVMILAGCNTEPLFDQLYEDRILLFMRGTYSSNNPKGFAAFEANASNNAHAKDDSVIMTDSSLELDPLESLRIDIAQAGVIRTSKGDFDINDEEDLKLLSNERQIFFFKFLDNPTFTADELYNQFDLDDPELSSTDIANRIALRTRQNAEFFNDSGYGVHYNGDDVAAGAYNKFRMFIRRIVTGEAKAFLKSDGSLFDQPVTATATFDNESVHGLEISQFYRFEEAEIYGPTKNYLFPYTKSQTIEIPSEDPFHIEIRLPAKNMMKYYEILEYNDLVYDRFWGFSDYKTDFTSSKRSLQGNFQMALRTYKPFGSGTISGTITSATCTSGGNLTDDCFIAVVASGSSAPEDYIPEMATGTASSNVYTVTNAAPGTYDIYLMRDQLKNSGVSGRDGFPETPIAGPVTVTVIAGAQTTGDITE